MGTETWQTVLAAGLVANATIGFGYRVYRLTKGGPMGDVIGQSILAALLVVVAVAAVGGASWGRWVALVYALLFGIAVMPVWVLAVLIPLPPRPIDYAFVVTYWTLLVVIAIAAILA